MHEDQGDRMGADHLMKRGDGTCDTHLPLPPNQFNRGLPRDASFWCKRCVRGLACAFAEANPDQAPVELADLVDLDDLARWESGCDDEEDDPEAEAERRARGIYPMGAL